MAVLPPLTLVSLWQRGRRRRRDRAQPRRRDRDRARGDGARRGDGKRRAVDRARDRLLRGVLLGAGTAASRRADLRADLRHAGAAARGAPASRSSRSSPTASASGERRSSSAGTASARARSARTWGWPRRLGGWIGVTLGGVVSDVLRAAHAARAPLDGVRDRRARRAGRRRLALLAEPRPRLRR